MSTLLGAWKLLEPIGRGGMGEVYAAERADGQFEMSAAVKILKRGLDTDALLRRFVRERNILARLSHPNIARLVDAGATSDGRPYFVMERVQGVPITDYCASHQSSLHDILRLMGEVCGAVGAAHRSQIVHRDLKPSNVLVTEAGEVKLLDFGVAKLLVDDEHEQTRTVAEAVLLTPSYAAPEQIRGETISTATDVYALGVMLHRLLTGQVPRVAARRKKLPGDLDLIVRKSLHADPQRRYRSAFELADDLQRYLERRPVQARPDSIAYRAGRFVQRYPIPVAAASIAIVALAIGLGAAVWQAKVARAEAEHALVAEAEAKKNLATAKAVSDFVTQDLLASVNPDKRSTANITLKDMLATASEQVDKRFADRPEVAAELHYALGRSYYGIGMDKERLVQQERAVALFEKAYGRDSEQTLKALFDLGVATKRQSDFAGALAIQQDVLARREKTLGEDHADTLNTRLEATALSQMLGEPEAAAAGYREIIASMARTHAPADLLRLAQKSLANVSYQLAEYAESEKLYRVLVVSLNEKPSEHHLLKPQVALELAGLLTARGRYQESEQIMSQLRIELPRQLPKGHWLFDSLDREWAILLLEQGHFAEASKLAQALLDRAIAKDGPEGEWSSDVLWIIADAYARSGQYQESATIWRRAMGAKSQFMALLHDDPATVTFHVGFADALRLSGRRTEAWKALDGIPQKALSKVPTRHPVSADRLRVQGLLWLHDGKKTEARAALTESLQIYELRLGAEHWRTKRAREELARVPAT